MKLSAFIIFILFATITHGQTAKKKTAKCNPLVLGSVPRKALSIQVEQQGGFNNDYTLLYGLPTVNNDINFSSAQNLRLNYYKPIVTKPNAFITVEAGYWYSKYNVNNTTGVPFFNDLDDSRFHSFSASTTIFKPLNAKNFILFNASVELNGNGTSFKKPGAKNLVSGGVLLYGWKKGLESMIGVGVLRAYRLGRVVHAPAFLWNKTFNKKWGVEMLLPARGFVRYTLKKTDFVMLGFDLEGTQYAYNSSLPAVNNSFFQRGEIKPRIGIDMQMAKNTRFTANVGCRINGRMDWADNYDGKILLVENNPGVNYFANVGFHILNIKTKKKKK
jgi:hypothetical protein